MPFAAEKERLPWNSSKIYNQLLSFPDILEYDEHVWLEIEQLCQSYAEFI